MDDAADGVRGILEVLQHGDEGVEPVAPARLIVEQYGLGQLLADVLPFNKKDGSPRRRSLRARRVNVEEKEAPAEDFQAEDLTEDVQLDASTTEDDIETILNNIHNRK